MQSVVFHFFLLKYNLYINNYFFKKKTNNTTLLITGKANRRHVEDMKEGWPVGTERSEIGDIYSPIIRCQTQHKMGGLRSLPSGLLGSALAT